MDVLETYSEVRTAFRRLWSDLGSGRLDLEIVCPRSFDSCNPPDTFRPKDVIGQIRVPLNNDLPRNNDRSLFSPWPYPIQIDANWVQPAQIKTFVELCRSAGLLLPALRKNEIRHYCEFDSRKPEELWIAHLLCLAQRHASRRPGDDVIRIRKVVEFSIDAITSGIDAGVLPPGPKDSSDDGPIPPNAFRWQGEEYYGLSRKPWLLVAHMWPRKNKSSDDQALVASGIWDDLRDVTKDSVGSVRRDANRFFRENRLPWSVTISKDPASKNGMLVTLKNEPPNRR